MNITASYPVYNQSGELQYVTGCDLLLSGISKFLSNLKVGKTGVTFIIEVAGVAHEINNPIGCVVGNVNVAGDYMNDLLNIIDLYSNKFPQPIEEI